MYVRTYVCSGFVSRAITTVYGQEDRGGITRKTAVKKEPLVRVIEGGNHALEEESHKQLFITGVEKFLASLTDVHVG